MKTIMTNRLMLPQVMIGVFFSLLLTGCFGGDSEDLLFAPGGAADVTVDIAILDSTGNAVGTSSNPITPSRPGFVQVQVNTPRGVSAANRLVSFSTTLGIGVFSGSPTALTNEQGLAVINLLAQDPLLIDQDDDENGDDSAPIYGADLLVATVTISDAEFTSDAQGTQGFNTARASGVDDGANILIGSGLGADFDDGLLAVSTLNVGAGSSIAVTANVVNAETQAPWLGSSDVVFSSICANAGTATFDPSRVSLSGGTATTSYTPRNGCLTDVISASVSRSGQFLTAQSEAVSIRQAAAQSIEFSGAEPAIIGLRGSAQAGRPEASVLTFLVKDSNGDPVPAGTQVRFSPVAELGGFGITSDPLASTNSRGQASVTVRSGSVPFVGAIKAQLETDPRVETVGQVSLQSGVINQDRFSLVLETVNPLVGNRLGETVEVIVRAADRFGNHAPDGTRINFSAELGDIEGSCMTEDGGCSVTWTSQASQSINYDVDRSSRECFAGSQAMADRMGLSIAMACGEDDRFGRNTIIATALGEEAFDDVNGDNVYDIGENWVAMPEAFRDDNETGLREIGDPLYQEVFFDFNNTGSYTGAGNRFRGLGCSIAAQQEGHCNQLANVRASAVMALSTDDIQIYPFALRPPSLVWQSNDAWGQATLAFPTGILTAVESSPMKETGSLFVVVADLNGNAPALGTTVEVSVPDGEVFGECVVGNRTNARVCEFAYVLDECTAGLIEVEAVSPSGLSRLRLISVNPVEACFEEDE